MCLDFNQRWEKSIQVAEADLVSITSADEEKMLISEFKKNGVTLQVVEPNQTTLENLSWKDPIFNPGETAYYYVRIVQDNGEEAISSPVWVN